MKKLLLAIIIIISCNSTSAQTALNFDGVNDFVLGTNNTSLNLTQGTIEAWIKTDNAGSSYRGIVVKHESYGMYLLDNILVAYQWNGNTYYSSTINLADGLWHHVAFSFNNGVANGSKLYIDGSPVLTFTYNLNINNSPISVGSGHYRVSPPSQNFNGEIDQVRVWNTVKTDAEILNIYNKCLTGAENGLVMLWQFEEGVGLTATDLSGNSNNGTLINMDETDWVSGRDCNLVAYYPFNNNIKDESGNANHGITNGATLTTDRFGNTNSAYIFDGVDDFIQVPNSNSLNVFNSDLTISMWLFNYSDTNNTYKGISKGGYDTGAGYELIFNNNYNNGELQFNISKSARRVPSMNTYNNQWVMLTGTYEHATQTSKTYINGIEKAFQMNKDDILKSSTSDLYIGRRAPNNLYMGYVNGKIDDIRIYKSALTEAEILNLYNLNTLKIEKFDKVTESPFYVNNNTLYFKKAQNLQEIETIEVYNSIGQKMLKTPNIKNEISFKTLPIGIYILKVKNFNSNIQTLRFLIN